jgi:hypothetical protein
MPILRCYTHEIIDPKTALNTVKKSKASYTRTAENKLIEHNCIQPGLDASAKFIQSLGLASINSILKAKKREKYKSLAKRCSSLTTEKAPNIIKTMKLK